MEGHGAGAERWGEGIQERASLQLALPGEKVLQGQHVLCVCMCVCTEVCPLVCSSLSLLLQVYAPYHYSASHSNPGSWALREEEVRHAT